MYSKVLRWDSLDFSKKLKTRGSTRGWSNRTIGTNTVRRSTAISQKRLFFQVEGMSSIMRVKTTLTQHRLTQRPSSGRIMELPNR
jgi:hypothetical protein